jgi:hypothetical protein
MRIYVTYCSAQKKDELRDTNMEVTPDVLYTSKQRIKPFMETCKGLGVRWAIWIRNTLNDLYNAYEFTEDFKFIDIRIIGDRVAASYSFTQEMTPLAGGEKIEQSGKGMAILKQDEMKNWQFEWNAYYLDNTDTSDKE